MTAQMAPERDGTIPQTLGQYRVGSTFNPSGDSRVDHLKGLAAAFIDACEEYMPDELSKDPDSQAEKQRLLRLAMDRVEEGAMWGVKAVTKRART